MTSVIPDGTQTNGRAAAAPTVFDAVNQVVAAMPAISKDHSAPASQGGYKFSGIEDYLAAANPLMAEAGVNVIPHRVIQSNVTERPISGNRVMYAVIMRVQYRVYGPGGDYFEGEAEGEAADVGDKATPKAHTAARKAFLKELLRITSVDDDPDRGDPEPTVRRDEQEAPWWIEFGWATQAEHDNARHALVEAITLLPDDLRAEIKESANKAGISFARALRRSEVDTVASWLPTDSRQTAPTPQGGQEPTPEVPPTQEPAPDAPVPQGVDRERWKMALAVVDAMKLPAVTEALGDLGLSTEGNGPDKRMRLAVAYAEDAEPDTGS